MTAVLYGNRPPRQPATTTEPKPNGLTASGYHPGPCPLGQNRWQPLRRRAGNKYGGSRRLNQSATAGEPGRGGAPPAATGRLTRRGKRHPDEPAAADPERETNTQLENRPRTGTTARCSCSTTSSTTAATAAVSYVDRPPRQPATTTEPKPNGLTASGYHPGPCPLGQNRRQPLRRRAGNKIRRESPTQPATAGEPGRDGHPRRIRDG